MAALQLGLLGARPVHDRRAAGPRRGGGSHGGRRGGARLGQPPRLPPLPPVVPVAAALAPVPTSPPAEVACPGANAAAATPGVVEDLLL
uniref:Uncharacterized protein n=1 Tax=Oryza brachyantha TaxID=4533 RepID=J3MXG1_ORYBR